MNLPKDSRKEENAVQFAIESQEYSNTCVSELDPNLTPISNVARSGSSSSCREELSLPNTDHGIHSTTIPKHIITTFDENYVLRCLELLRNCALRAAASNLASKVHISHDDFTNLAETKSIGPHDMAKLTIGCPSVTGSPLLQKSGSVDFDIDFRRKNSLEPVYSDLPNFRRKNSLEPVYSDLTEMEVTFVDPIIKNYVSPPGHKRIVSVSSTNTSCSDKSSSSASATSFQGMLQCTWKHGLPQYVFTVDDKTEVYVASLSKPEPSGDEVLDYVYTFCTRKKELESQSVGTMRVSTSITLCPNNSSEVRETRFILSLSSDDPIDELQISNHNRKKSKRLTSKVAKVFRSSHSYKQKSCSKFRGSPSAIFEDSPWEPSENPHKSVERGVEKDSYVPNLELAAVIVKDVCKNPKENDLGGWGLKFLKKPGKDVSLKTTAPSECMRNYGGECSSSTSLDVLIPAGIHGGPKTRVGGPSSLTERWMSGGRCDCGGWDTGCPLTVLNAACIDSSADLFIQGSKQDVPIFKMTNKHHDGSYDIHFQSTLSALQCFAIAAAIIHFRG